MLDKFTKYAVTLEHLSNQELDRSAEQLVGVEKRKVAKLIAHVAEMSRRKAALALGYKSLFNYCVLRLPLSEGSVASRIHIANVSIRFPQVLVALSENRLSLTVAGQLAPHLKEDNVDKLLSDCAGMTKNAVREYVIALAPKPVHEPSIPRRPEPKHAPEVAPTTAHSKTSSNVWRKSWVSKTLRCTWPRLSRRLSTSPSRKRTRKRSSSAGKRAGAHLVRTRSPSSATFPPRSSNEFTPERAINVNIRGRTERDAVPGPDSILTTCDHLCPAHNRLEAERVYGAAFIQRKIDERRARQTGEGG